MLSCAEHEAALFQLELFILAPFDDVPLKDHNADPSTESIAIVCEPNS